LIWAFSRAWAGPGQGFFAGGQDGWWGAPNVRRFSWMILLV